RALEQRQQMRHDESLLPKVTLGDVKPDIHVPQFEHLQLGVLPATYSAQGTNGLIYQQLLIELPPLPAHLLALLPYYTQALTEVGVGARDYLATQEWQSEVCGSIHAFTTMRGAVADEQDVKAYLVLSSKALVRNLAAQGELMKATLEQVRWDEHERLRDLVAQQRARREQSITGNGHSYAMNAASAGMSPVARLTHELHGLAGLQAVKVLDTDLEEVAALANYADHLRELHALICAGHKQLLI